MTKKIFKSIFSKQNDSLGATMLEFAIVILFTLGLLGLIVEGGLAIWRHSLLTENLALIVVDRSIHLEQNKGLSNELSASCSSGNCNLTSCVQDMIFKKISLQTGVTPGSLLIQVENPNNILIESTREITLSATWDTNCILCSIFGLRSLPMSATAYAPIEASKIEALIRCPGAYS